MLPDRVSNPGPLTYESGVLPIALRGPAQQMHGMKFNISLDIVFKALHVYGHTFFKTWANKITDGYDIDDILRLSYRLY